MRHLRLCPPLLRRLLRMAPTELGRLLSAQGMHAFKPPYIRGHDRGNLRARGGRESSSMKMFLP